MKLIMSDPLISVIMPVFNEERYVRMAVESILNQTFPDYEFIILDDGSTDNTVEIIRSFSDKRIKFFTGGKNGIASQLNKGLEIARGKFIARMDADDRSELNRFDEQLSLITSSNAPDIIGTDFVIINSSGKKIIERNIPETHEKIINSMPVITSVCHGSILTFRSVLTSVGGYSTNRCFAEDQHLFLKLIRKGFTFYNIPKVLYNYRIKNSRVGKSKYIQLQSTMYANGMEHLNEIKKNGMLPDNETFIRALIEYYHGNVSNSRKYFINQIFDGKDVIRSLRYLLVSLLGDNCCRYLRERMILALISRLFRKHLGIDLHRIE